MSFNYFNPRTPGGVRRKYISFALILYPISIHAPRVGCDGIISAQVPSVANFNPRTPGGVRPIYANGIIYDLTFQSTHPGWGATRFFIVRMAKPMTFQSTHPGWGATVIKPPYVLYTSVFQSTHPGWGATHAKSSCIVIGKFQSTHPGWGATLSVSLRALYRAISIHAPRVGCDV